MKINLMNKLKDAEGNLIDKRTKEEKAKKLPLKPLILRDLCYEACLVPAPEETETVEEKAKSYVLFQKLQDQKEADLKAEDIAFLKQKIGKRRSTLIMGQAWEMLESKKQKMT